MSRTEELKNWFSKLPSYEQKEVLRFLYDDMIIEVEGYSGKYYGPHRRVVKEGLFCGPAPIAMQQINVCPSCKRPF